MKICVVGLGKLGAPLAAVIASRGHEVYGCDSDSERVEKWIDGQAPVEETGLQELMDQSGGNFGTAVVKAAAIGARIVFITVPTPSLADGSFSLEYVRSVMFELAFLHLQGIGVDYQVIAVVSTVSPGSMANLKGEFEAASGKTVGLDVGLVYDPSFIALGDVIKGLTEPDYVLLGQQDEQAGNVLEHFWGTIHQRHCRRMSWASAEIAKLALNVALDVKISYALTVVELCEKYAGADAWDVLGAVGADQRIGPAFLKPGTGYGGPCLPRDCEAFAAAAEKVGVQAALADAADEVNDHQVGCLADLAQQYVHSPPAIGILGTSYKTGTLICEKSTGSRLYRTLAYQNRELHAQAAPTENPGGLDFYTEMCSVLVLCTPWPEYREQLPAALAKVGKPRTLIDPWGVFRGVALPPNVRLVIPGIGPKE